MVILTSSKLKNNLTLALKYCNVYKESDTFNYYYFTFQNIALPCSIMYFILSY